MNYKDDSLSVNTGEPIKLFLTIISVIFNMNQNSKLKLCLLFVEYKHNFNSEHNSFTTNTYYL